MRARSRRPSLAFVVVVVVVASALTRATHARTMPMESDDGARASERANGTRATLCANAHASAHAFADDRGKTCAWNDMDFSTGCCARGSERESESAKCEENLCCVSYETCVARCQGPSHDVQRAMRAHARGRNQQITGYFSDAFAYCANRCRTQPSVTVHENTYVTDAKYCYGDYPKNEDPVPALKGKSFAGDGPDESK